MSKGTIEKQKEERINRLREQFPDKMVNKLIEAEDMLCKAQTEMYEYLMNKKDREAISRALETPTEVRTTFSKTLVDSSSHK